MANTDATYRFDTTPTARQAWGWVARGEVMLALGVVGIVVLMILPIPAFTNGANAAAADRRSDNERYERRHDNDDDHGNGDRRDKQWRNGRHDDQHLQFRRNSRRRFLRNDAWRRRHNDAAVAGIDPLLGRGERHPGPG